jgi:NADH-quinone oxidoreductase subunit G
LPIALYAENEGTFINVEGRMQGFAAVITPPGEARAGWKVLRRIAETLGLEGFGFECATEITAAFLADRGARQPDNLNCWRRPDRLGSDGNGVRRVTLVPMNAADPLVRRAAALQLTPDAADGAVHLNVATAKRLGLEGTSVVLAEQNGASLRLPLAIDARCADGVALLHGGNPDLAVLGPGFGAISLRSA